MGRLHLSRSLSALCLGLLLSASLAVLYPYPTGARPGAASRRSAPTGPSSAFMPTSQLRPGMKGYGLTVFRGTRVERFPITILGVLRSYIADSDLILIRVTGGYPAEHGVGIVAGMSGSPVYVEGRLVGAVAYGWPFSKEPIGGVTPIANMLRDLPPDLSGASSAPRGPGSEATPALRATESRPLPEPIRVANRVFTRVQVLPAMPRDSSPPHTIVLTPVNTLLQLRGFGPGATAGLDKLLRPLHLEAVRTFAPTAPAERHPAPSVQPGAALGVQLLTGDLEISGTGTLTYLDGPRFLAFGHPMSQLGTVSLPATLARIHDILPSYNRPFKFASPVRVIGELASDRLWAVGGYLGRRAPTLPVRVRRIDRTEGQDRTYRMQATTSRFLAPAIIGHAILQALGSDPPSALESTLRVRYRIRPQGHAPIEGDQMYSGAGVETHAAMHVAEILLRLTGNEFQSLRLEGVDVEAQVLHGRHTATVQKVYTGRSRYARGESVDIHVILKPYGQAAVEKVVHVPVPLDLPKGALVVGVAGGGDVANLRKRLQLPKPEPENLRQVLGALASTEKNQELLVRVLLPTQAAVVGGERLGLLPESLREILPAMPQGGITGERDCLEMRLPTPWVLRGVESTQVEVSPPPPASPTLEAPTAPTAPTAPSPVDESRSVSVRGPLPASHAPVLLPVRGAEVTVPNIAPAPVKPAPSPSPSFLPSSATTRQVLPAGTRHWDLRDVVAFARGQFAGTGLSRGGEISLAPSARSLLDTRGVLVWSLACTAQGTAWAGCAEQGRVHALAWPSGTPRTGFHVEDAAVTALAVGSGDSLWVGTAPHARVYHRSPAGDLRSIAVQEGGYVWAFLPRADGSALVATGLPACLYHVTPSGTVRRVHRFSERHLRALAATSQGDILAATAGPGVVYRFPATLGAAPEPMFTSRYSSVDALAVGPSGEIAAASGRDLYRQLPGQALRVIPVSDHPLLDVVSDGDGAFLVGGTSGRIYRVDPTHHVTRVAATDGGPVMALLRVGTDLLAATGRPGGVLALSGATPAQGNWTSDVLDAGSVARWGRARWLQGRGRPGTVTLQTRSGFTPAPDTTWSPWSSALTSASGQAVTSPPARYLQVRANLAGEADTPTLALVSLYYRNQDEAPILTVERPAAGDAVAGTARIAWTAIGAGIEFLTYDLLSSRDDAPAWTPVQLGLSPRLKEHPPSDSDPAALAQANEYSWDTRRVPDGRYRVKIVARPLARPSEKPTEVVTAPFTVVNSRPEIVVLKQDRVAGGSGVRLRAVAKSHLVWVASVTWRQGRQEWQVAEPEDGVLDSDRESFSLVAKEGPEVEIRVTDEAGNTHTMRVAIRP